MMLRHADANHDGRVSLAEAQTTALARFDKIDTDHDGVLSDAEREAGRARMAERLRDRRAPWMEHNGDMPSASPAAPSTPADQPFSLASASRI